MALETAASELSAGSIVIVCLACVVGSALVGAVGVGGVIIVPTMVACGVDPRVGIASLFVGMGPMAMAKLAILSRVPGLIPWRAAWAVGAGAAIGAAVGGVVVSDAPRQLLAFLVSGAALLAALRDVVATVAEHRRRWQQRRQERAEKAAAEQSGADGDRVSGAEVLVELKAEAADGEAEAEVEGSGDDVGAKEGSGGAESATGGGNVGAKERNGAESATGGGDASTSRSKGDHVIGGQTRLKRLLTSYTPIPERHRWVATTRERLMLLGAGVAIGFGSVLTATGGPLLFIPLLLVWKPGLHRKVVVGCCALLGMMLGSAAIISVVARGLYPDPGLVIMIAPCGLLGVLLGVRILELVSIEVLQHGMAGALLVVGTLTLWQASTRDYSEDTENAPPPPVVV